MYTHKVLKHANKCIDMETHNQKPTRDNTAPFSLAIYNHVTSKIIHAGKLRVHFKPLD